MTGMETPIMTPRPPRVRSDTGGAIAAEGCRRRHAASTAGMALLTMAHDLERIGDRVNNITERTIWVATGGPPD